MGSRQSTATPPVLRFHLLMVSRINRDSYRQTIPIVPETRVQVYRQQFMERASQQGLEASSVVFKFYQNAKEPREVMNNAVFKTTEDIFVGPIAVHFSIPNTSIAFDWQTDDIGMAAAQSYFRTKLAIDFGFFLPKNFSLVTPQGQPPSDLTEMESLSVHADGPPVTSTMRKPNGEEIPFMTFGEPTNDILETAAVHSLQPDPKLLEREAAVKVYVQPQGDHVYDLVIKQNFAVYTLVGLPTIHCPIFLGEEATSENGKHFVERFLDDSLLRFGDNGVLPHITIRPSKSEKRLGIEVHGVVTTFVLPTLQEIQVFLMNITNESVEAFAKKYLQTQCGYDGELSVVQEAQLRFKIQLPTPPPSVTSSEPGALSIKVSFGNENEKVQFRWKWPNYKPIQNVYDEIAVLVGVSRHELEFLFPEDFSVIRHYFQLVAARQNAPLLVRRKSISVPLTLNFRTWSFPIEFESTDRVISLREHAMNVLSRADATLKVQDSDLILSVGDQVLKDGMRISELRHNVVTVTVPSSVKVHFKLETGAEPRLLLGEFPRAATVKDGRDWVSQEIKRPSDMITLFYGGKELRDTQMLNRLRLQPNSFVLIWVDEPNDVLLQSMKCLQMKPKPIHFFCESDNEAFDIEFHGGDLIDAVRVRVAAKFSVEPTQIQLWFADQLLFDDVMIDAIGLGDDSQIRVAVQSAENVSAFARLTGTCLLNSLCRFSTFSSILTAPIMTTGPGDVNDVVEPSAYDDISGDDMRLIRQIMMAHPSCSMSEQDVVLKFRECNKNLEELQKAIESN
jgi:hypothetical protein